MTGSDWCFAHSRDEEVKKQRHEAAVRGGSTTSARRRLLLGAVTFDTPESIGEFWEALVRATLRNEIPAQRATAVSGIVESMVRLRRSEELEGRLLGVETALQALLERRMARDGEEIV